MISTRFLMLKNEIFNCILLTAFEKMSSLKINFHKSKLFAMGWLRNVKTITHAFLVCYWIDAFYIPGDSYDTSHVEK
jgi:hypothetical protein